MIFFSSSSFAQLTVNTTSTPLQLAQALIGTGFALQNVKLNCPALAGQMSTAVGTFTGTTNIGIANGVLLTTGLATNAVGPNSGPTATSTGFNWSAPGDADLDNIAGTTTFDGCALEMDLIPACDTLKIEYVFASEEYPEYVGKEFNDVFALLLSGPGIVGKKNIATIPGTTQVISINNVNAGKNATYFVNNGTGGIGDKLNGTTIQYDGFTKPMTATAVVQPCGLYHLKIVIADVVDGIYDSGIFVKGKSITCTNTITTWTDPATSVDAVKGCLPGTFTFCRGGDSTKAYTVNYSILGTATNGVHYKTITNSVVIPAGQACANVSIVTIDDGIAGPVKTVALAYQHDMCPVPDTVRIIINSSLPFYAGPDVVVCSKDTVPIGVAPVTGYTYSWSPTAGLSNPAISNPLLSYTNTGATPIQVPYVLSASVAGQCIKFDTVMVTVRPRPTVDFSISGVCIGSPSSFQNLSTPATGSFIKSYYWNFGVSLFDTSKNPTPTFYSTAAFNVGLLVTDNYGCTDQIIKPVNIWPTPVVDFTTGNVCVGSPVDFTDNSQVPGGSISQSIWDFGDNTTVTDSASLLSHNYTSLGTYKVLHTIISDKNCTAKLEKTVLISQKPSLVFTFPPACQFQNVKFVNLSVGDIWLWNFGDGDTSSLRSPFHAYQLPGKYPVTLKGVNKFGCTESLVDTILVNPRPVVTFRADTVAGCAPLCIVFKASSLDPLKQWEWKWPSGPVLGNNALYCFNTEGNFSPTLIATSNSGCKDTVIQKNMITVYPAPKAGFSVYSIIANSLLPEMRLTNTETGAITWSWNFGDGQTESQTLNPVHRYAKAGLYDIRQTVVNQHGCRDSTVMKIEIVDESSVYIPNTITPNTDRNNNYFIPVCSGDICDADFEMSIFNRWGEKIFSSTSLSNPWDGRVSGNIVQNDVYVYVVVFRVKGSDTELKRFKGNVNVIK